MKLRTYQAYTMAEALAAVKRDLGADAVILNTRTFKRSTLLGLRRKTIVEVTATPAEQAMPRRTKDRSVPPPTIGARSMAASAEARSTSPKQLAARRAYGGASGAPGSGAVTDDDRERTRRLATAMQEKLERERAEGQTRSTPAISHTDAEWIPNSVSAPQHEVKPTEILQPAPVADPASKPAEASPRRFMLVPPGEESPTASASSSASASTPGTSNAMDVELAAIKNMVSQVLARQSTTAQPAPSLPPKLMDFYLNLIAQDMSEELADQIVGEVRDRLTREDLDDEVRVRAAVVEELAKLIPVSADPVPISSPDGRPLTIALVGPTGVGKTTTLAKLAATFKLRHKKKVGLITSDTYRIAAVDQLRTYANIIGWPLQVALTPAEMRQAVHHLSHCDVILVDTAGRSQNDVLRIDELRKFLEAAAAHEVHLVLSSTASEKVLLREAEAFSHVGVHKIVLTKLDEAVSFGMLVNVIQKIGKELSFITTGQEVPDHIEPGRPGKLAELVLGGSLHE